MEMAMVSHTTTVSPPVSGLYEYLLVVQPGADVYAQVMAEKQFFATQFKAPVAIKTKPHITVAAFLAAEAMEETIIRWMHRVISMKQSFNVTLDRYKAFRPHTICINVQSQEPFLQLARELKVVDQYIQGYGCPQMHLVSNAHLTIARRLDSSTYYEAVKVYAEKTFHGSFDVTQLILLRRKDQFDSCRQVSVFGLRT